MPALVTWSFGKQWTKRRMNSRRFLRMGKRSTSSRATKASEPPASTYPAVVPHQIKNAAGLTVNNPERRDGLGTTHHEAGTLRMGDNANDSVTDVNCRFHGVKNTYTAGPALFPTNGSPNPMLT